MNILFYSPSSIRFGGGGERWMLKVGSELITKKHCCVTIATTQFALKDVGIDKTLYQEIEKEKIILTELPYIRPPFGGLLLTREGFKILLDLARNSDVIYFLNSFPFQDMTVVLLTLLSEKPCINGIHNPAIFSNDLYGYYSRTLGIKMMNAFACSHVLNASHEKILKNLGLNNSYRIPNGVDTERFKPSKRNCNDKFRVLFVGRLSLRKGIDILCNAIRIYNQRYQDHETEFLIIGKGSKINLIRKIQEDYQNVAYQDFVPTETLPRIYSNSNLFVLPSRNEIMPLVALEAQSSGLPIVASSLPWTSEVVIDGRTGSIIKDSRDESYASSIAFYYRLWKDHRVKYDIICETSRTNVLKYDWSNIVDKLFYMLRSEAGCI